MKILAFVVAVILLVILIEVYRHRQQILATFRSDAGQLKAAADAEERRLMAEVEEQRRHIKAEYETAEQDVAATLEREKHKYFS